MKRFPKLVSCCRRRCGTYAATAAGRQKEAELQSEAQAWQAPSSQVDIPLADPSQVPVLDFRSPTFSSELRDASTEVGFYLLKGHGLSEAGLSQTFEAAERFFALPLEEKQRVLMDKAPTVPSGCGYLPLNNFKLPKRAKGNLTEAFIVKREHGPRDITLDDMPWPKPLGRSWRDVIEAHAAAMEHLALRMLPHYAAALRLPHDYWSPAFKSPLWRLRLAYYPLMDGYEDNQYGISPHVDTSMFTLLVQREPGLVVHHAPSRKWLRVEAVPGTVVVNTGEILRNLTNDTWISAKHYALNAEGKCARLSLPFFFCPTADYKCSVVPTCIGADRPARYPPTSYLDGQGVAQGE